MQFKLLKNSFFLGGGAFLWKWNKKRFDPTFRKKLQLCKVGGVPGLCRTEQNCTLLYTW